MHVILAKNWNTAICTPQLNKFFNGEHIDGCDPMVWVYMNTSLQVIRHGLIVKNKEFIMKFNLI